MIVSLLAGYALLLGSAPVVQDNHDEKYLRYVKARFQAAPQTPIPAKLSPEQRAVEQHKRDVAADIELGKKYAEEVDKEYKPSTSKEYNDRLQRIGAEFAKIANETHAITTWGDKEFSQFEYKFKVIKGDDVNAFSIPGGYLYFFEGLMRNAESDDEIAGVVAHEIAHAALRHVATLQREQQKLQNISLPLVLLAILTNGGSMAAEALTVGQLLSQAKGSGWSVKAEEAADYAGIQYMLKSKYNPTGMLTFMERLAMQERATASIDWGIYRSHPPSRERAQSLAAYMSVAGVPVRRSKVTTTYRATVVPGEQSTVDLMYGKRKIVSFGGSDALARADFAADRVNEFFDDIPDLFELRAGADGQILARGRLLFVVDEEDAKAAEMTRELLRDDVVKNLKFALLNIGFRIWDRP